MQRPVANGGGRRRSLTRTLAVVPGALLLAACSSTLPQSSLNPKSAEARQIDDLWILVLVIATIVFVIVEAALVFAIFRFRKRKDDDREPKQIHGNTALEIVWSIIPAVILAAVAVPTLQTLFDLRSPAEGDVVNVNVTGHQWWWEFEYPDILDDQGRPLTTANELHLPVGKTAELKMTSADVIHSFWVPPLGGKRDLVPGRETFIKITPDADRAGEQIPGQCAEFCWLSHADMRMLVFLQTESDFAAWAASQTQPADIPTDGLAASGYETFTAVCAACHQAVVAGPGGTVSVVGEALAPDLTHFGSRSTLGARVASNTAEHLAQWIDNPSDFKAMAPDLNDFGTGRILGMPDYGLGDDEIAGLVALLEGWK
ncbi:MAG: cytochrome c oxidase subunit II [Acidimicrobiia bacterium]|nr:MAG: cytochrome c oxidase subunit II [Acidimicrobiia bacterium]